MGICFGTPVNTSAAHSASVQDFGSKTQHDGTCNITKKSYIKGKIGSNPSNLQTNPKTLCESIGTDESVSTHLKAFTFNDLKTATKNFCADSLIGEGGFGYVFKGWINENTLAPSKPGSGTVVAVKNLKALSFQGHREWLKFNAKLSDFGLARKGPSGDGTHVSTRVVGTMGYAAPEYVASGHLTPKNDVYSFGVVLLELLSGRRAMGDETMGGIEGTLVDWARPFLGDSRQFSRIMDTRLRGEYSKKGAQAASSLALRCLSCDPKNRPSMVEVLAELEQVQIQAQRNTPLTMMEQHVKRTSSPHKSRSFA
ncbi:hypothetical protein RD792_009954 [Penstemon davidsonii]|uniref:Protein kinase domain-containing protein n=1 Tax=Penstemon davidsonii TaxID=160366 RepID=A0ABR0D0I0_9LAMI|nr:hypothetical protein RD792_009954 [Penstemon davidsonii]